MVEVTVIVVEAVVVVIVDEVVVKVVIPVLGYHTKLGKNFQQTLKPSFEVPKDPMENKLQRNIEQLMPLSQHMEQSIFQLHSGANSHQEHKQPSLPITPQLQGGQLRPIPTFKRNLYLVLHTSSWLINKLYLFNQRKEHFQFKTLPNLSFTI
jgi:hypothetical protein